MFQSSVFVQSCVGGLCFIKKIIIMKKSFFAILMIAFISFSACAQKIKESAVPSVVKSTFVKHYPGITPKWEKEKNNFEAGFKNQGVSTSVLIDTKGGLLETEVDIKVEELPAAAMSYLKEHYKGQKIKEAAKITKADGTVNFEAEVSGKDVMFDAAGKFLKEVKD